MTEVEVGGQTVELAGCARAPLTWYSEFKDDGLYDALLACGTHRRGRAPSMPMRDILRCAWVMAHDADEAAGRQALGFKAWVADHPSVDFTALREAVNREAMASFFPSAARAAERASQRARKAARRGPAAGGDAGVRQEDGS